MKEKFFLAVVKYLRANAKHVSLVFLTSFTYFFGISTSGALFFLTRTEVINSEIDRYYNQYPNGGIVSVITSVNAQDDFSFWRPNMGEFSKGMAYSTYNKAYYVSTPNEAYSPMEIPLTNLGTEAILPVIGFPANHTWMAPSYLGLELLASSDEWYVEGNNQMFITQEMADVLILENSFQNGDYVSLIDVALSVKTGTIDCSFTITGVIANDSLGLFADRYGSRFAIVGSNSILYWFRNLEIHITMGKSSKSNYLFLKKIIQTCETGALYRYDFREIHDGELVSGMVQAKYLSSAPWFESANYIPVIAFAILAVIGIGTFIFSSVDYIERTRNCKGLFSLTSFQLVYIIVFFSFVVSALIMYAFSGQQFGSLVFLPYGISATAALIATYISLLIVLKIFIFFNDKTKKKRRQNLSDDYFDRIDI